MRSNYSIEAKEADPMRPPLTVIHHGDDLSGVGNHVALDGRLGSIHVGQSLFQHQSLGTRDASLKVKYLDELVPFISDHRCRVETHEFATSIGPAR